MDRALLIASLLVVALTYFEPVQDKSFSLSTDERQLIDLTNAERKKNGLPALKFSPVLCEVARAHAANMARQGELEHVLDGKTPSERIKDAGYKPALSGENIARVRGSLEELMTDWMNSKDHRKNILYPEFTEIGVGMAKDAMGQVYYAQVLTKPR